MNFGALVRLSFELHHGDDYKDAPTSGIEINNRVEQEKKIRDYIEKRGGKVTFIYDEPHTSAWKKKPVTQPDGTVKYLVVRPVFEGALRDLKRGVDPNGVPIHGLAVRADDRLARDARHMEDAIELVEYHDRPIIDVSGLLDLLTEGGREAAGYMVKAAARYSKSISIKGKDSHKARAYLGIPAGGQRPFGWKNDRRTKKKSEARLLKETVEWVLDGVGIQNIEKRWYERGIRSMNNPEKPVNRRTIHNMLLNPRIAGIRKYRNPGKPIQEHYLLDKDGNYIMGQWDAIITVETWEAVVEKLTNSDRPGAGIAVGKLKALSSTVVVCGECFGPVSRQPKENDRYDYACKNVGCGKVAGSGIEIDRILTERALEELARKRVSLKPKKWSKAGELKDLEEEKASYVEDYHANKDLGSVILPKVRDLTAQINELRKERAKFAASQAKPRGDNLVERWPDLEVEQQRAIFEEVFEVVVLNKASRASSRFDPKRLHVEVKKSLSLDKLRFLTRKQVALAA